MSMGLMIWQSASALKIDSLLFFYACHPPLHLYPIRLSILILSPRNHRPYSHLQLLVNDCFPCFCSTTIQVTPGRILKVRIGGLKIGISSGGRGTKTIREKLT
ncbi:unnamed protein product [Linum trigynum]|uniref:Ribosomal protein L2 n=1 Tax=Linum trigynum TaxID=586398 RepID=A0AAV2CX14_9ROSI